MILSAATVACAAFALLLAVAIESAAAPQQRAPKSDATSAPRQNLKPQLVPGEVLRYQVEFQTTSDTKTGGAIEDPEGPSHLVIVWDAKIRLEVLPGTPQPSGSASIPATAAPAANAATNTLRLRTTYEQSAATVHSDSPDPQADTIVAQYQQLEGRSIEFSLAPDGQVSAVSGLEGILNDANTVNAAQRWMAQLSAGGAAPATGVAPGMVWSSEQEADSLPFAGMSWRTDSTYERDEPCGPALPAATAASLPNDSCAVILMSLKLSPTRTKGDPTAPEFRQKGLQTAGHWNGSGDSLSYVSLKTGWVVSASQTSTQEMDVSISSALGTTVHYAGTVQTHSQISLLPSQESQPATALPAR